MRLYVLAVCTTLLHFNATAQQPFGTFTDQSHWSVLHGTFGMGWYFETDEYVFVDTLSICGETYSVLPFQWQDTAYVRNDGQRVLYRNTINCIDKEYLMYDYSLAIGDSAYFGQYLSDPDTGLFIVDTIDHVVISGVSRLRYTMLYDRNWGTDPLNEMVWIQGVGSLTNPFHSLSCLSDWCESSYRLLCYDSLGIQLFLDEQFDTCSFTNVGIVDPGTAGQDSEFIVALDAGNSSLLLTLPTEFSNGTLAIYDATGKLIGRENIGNGNHTIQNTFTVEGLLIGILSERNGTQWKARWISTHR